MNHEYSKQLKTVFKLRPERKEAMKRVLLAQIDERLRITELARHKGWRTPAGFFLKHARVFAVAALLVVVGGGTVFAAEEALPGDLLYPVKVGVSEPVAGFFTLGAKARAGLETQLAGERGDEAAKLQSEGRLSDEVKTELKTEFDAHATNALKNLDALRARDPKSAEDMQAKLQDRLDRAERILNAIEDSGNDEWNSGKAEKEDHAMSPEKNFDTENKVDHGNKNSENQNYRNGHEE